MGINDFGDTDQGLNAPLLGGPNGWAAAVRDALNSKLDRLAGGIITGVLQIRQENSTAAGARLKVDSGGSGIGTLRYAGPTSGFIFDIDGGTGSPAERPVLAFGEPTAPTHGATKAYVDAVGTWQAWTPTLTNMTASVVTARYTKIGRTVHWLANLTVASVTGSDPMISMPVPVGGTVIGEAYYVDNGTSGYLGITVNSGSNMRMRYPTPAANAITPVTATAPFPWAAGDLMYLKGTYETAS